MKRADDEKSKNNVKLKFYELISVIDPKVKEFS